MNPVRNRMEAERDLRNASKMVKNFEILSADINSNIAKLHSIGLKAAISQLERAKLRVDRAKEMVRLRIQVLKSKRKP